jgi:hypothetical protein
MGDMSPVSEFKWGGIMKEESKEDKERRLAFLRGVRKYITDELSKRTFPFYQLAKSGQALFGTGVLLQIDERMFAISAAHVFDRVEEILRLGDQAVIHTCDPTAPFLDISLWRVCKSKAPGGDRDADKLDLAIAEIPAEATIRLQHRRPVRLCEIEAEDRHQINGRYLVFGYPKTGSRLEESSNTLIYDILPYLTSVYQGQRGELLEYDSNLEIALDFIPKNTTDHDGNPGRIFRPNGISGCGIWRVFETPSRMDNWDPSDLKLVGLEHSWNHQIQVLRGTRIRCALVVIAHHYPELRPALSVKYA